MKIIRRALLPFCFVALLPLSGCLDTDALIELASAAKQTISLLESYSNDLVESCKRREPLELTKPACDNKVAERLLPEEVIMLAYFEKMELLAGVDGAKLTDNVDALGTAVGDLEKFDEETVGTFVSIGKSIGKFAVKRFRQKQLRKYITKVDRQLAMPINHWKKIIDEDYRTRLESEKVAIEGKIGSVKKAHGQPEPLATEMRVAELTKQLSKVNNRIASIDKFNAALDTLASAHHRLYDKSAKIDAKKMSKLTKGSASYLRKASKEIKSAFN